jgi:hypothetical protein
LYGTFNLFSLCSIRFRHLADGREAVRVHAVLQKSIELKKIGGNTEVNLQVRNPKHTIVSLSDLQTER